MKDRLIVALLSFSLTPTLFGCAKQTTVPSTYDGTVSIKGTYLDECYSGIVRIDQDGDKIRVTVTDAVESDFDEWF